KATFEACIGYRNADETKRLKHIASLVDEMQEALPITAEMKATRKTQQSSPFVVMDLLAAGGEAKCGVPAMAFVLPNDPAIIEKHGTKKVMMKNVQQAKFNEILMPIAERFLAPHALERTTFDAFFRHTILHETGHSLGPKAVQNSPKTIIQHLADLYAPIEECKADTTSYFLCHWLLQRGELTQAELEENYATMVAGFFRSMRFGTSQAHARANAIQLNFFLEAGAVILQPDGMFDYDAAKLTKAVPELLNRLMTLEYEGNRDNADAFLKKYGVISDELAARFAELDDIPIDIVCKFEAEEPGFFDN
ncbi:MAG: hypothetical protein J6A01_06585, partial [Proteobacteria bacterium]|nr:hypothetical protein [Pseudomonadota bacterium]